MTIKVESSGVTAAEPKPAVETKAENTSAPEAKASEQKPAAESDPAETETEAEDEALEPETDPNNSGKDQPKKKGGFQKRIDKLNARNSAAQAEIDHWKAMALKGAAEPKAEKIETPKNADGKPDPANFDTHSEYVEALTDYKIEQREKAKQEIETKSKLKDEQEKVINSYSERVKAFSEKHADFNEVVDASDDVPCSATVREIILSSENGPALTYELAKNPDEARRISALPPLAAAREMGRLEAKLSAPEESKPEPKKITNAPAPIKPTGGKGGVVEKSIYDPSLSQSEYERLRAKQRSASG